MNEETTQEIKIFGAYGASDKTRKEELTIALLENLPPTDVYIGEGTILTWSTEEYPSESEPERILYTAEVEFPSGTLNICNCELSSNEGEFEAYIGNPIFKVGDTVGLFRTGEDATDAYLVVI